MKIFSFQNQKQKDMGCYCVIVVCDMRVRCVVREVLVYIHNEKCVKKP